MVYRMSKDEEIDPNKTVDVEIKVSNGWWSMGVMTAANAEKVIHYAGTLVGELEDSPS